MSLPQAVVAFGSFRKVEAVGRFRSALSRRLFSSQSEKASRRAGGPCLGQVGGPRGERPRFLPPESKIPEPPGFRGPRARGGEARGRAPARRKGGATRAGALFGERVASFRARARSERGGGPFPLATRVFALALLDQHRFSCVQHGVCLALHEFSFPQILMTTCRGKEHLRPLWRKADLGWCVPGFGL